MKARIVAAIAGVSVCLLTTAVQAEVFVYPKAGSNQEQFQRDQFECHQWAQGQTGVNPTQPATVQAPAPQRGGAVRGAAGGAAIGAIGGAIGGDAGKGAAVGAGVGGTAGLMRQGVRNKDAAQAAQQAQTQQETNLQRYEQAYAACLAGRGYQVR